MTQCEMNQYLYACVPLFFSIKVISQVEALQITHGANTLASRWCFSVAQMFHGCTGITQTQ